MVGKSLNARRNRFIVYTDLKGFSQMEEQDFINFHENYLQLLYKKVKKYHSKAEVWNTWGDAFIAVFEKGIDAAELMIDYREFFQTHLKIIQPRIAGHYGSVIVYEDPMLEGKKNAIGDEINKTARVEPVTFPGEIYVTNEFKKQLIEESEDLDVFFNPLGVVRLAKSYGEAELFRMYPANQERWNVTSLLHNYDIKQAIPSISEITEEYEKSLVEKYKEIKTKKEFELELDRENLDELSGPFYFEMADWCRKIGLYEKALVFLKKAENWNMEVESISLRPYLYNKQFLKLKANCLSKIAEYQEAAELMYCLLQADMDDFDTISMLAAQFKRRALFGDKPNNENQKINKEQIDYNLLKIAMELYLEAYRKKIDAYYPAINAAYLQKMLKIKDALPFADYISQRWEKERDPDWYYYSMQAETQLIADRFDEAKKLMERAIRLGKPDNFKRQSTLVQIKQYLKVVGLESEGKPIIDLLENECLVVN